MSGLLSTAGLVAKGDPVSLSEQNQTVVTTTIDLYSLEGKLIGYCTGLDRTDARTVNLIRHFSSADGGRVVEQALGPDNTTLRVTGFSLYNDAQDGTGGPHGTLLARLGKNVKEPAKVFKSLNSQRIPFTVKYQHTHPGTSVKDTIYFYNCIINNWAHPASLGNVTIAETASIQVGQVDSQG